MRRICSVLMMFCLLLSALYFSGCQGIMCSSHDTSAEITGKIQTDDNITDRVTVSSGESVLDFVSGYAPLSDFRFVLNDSDKTISLTEYTGDAVRVLISSVYSIDGEDYTVTDISGSSCFYCNYKITAVYVPEGVTSLSIAAFNSCMNLRYLYLPSTLNNTDFMSYIHSDLFVYYGGSEENWKSLNVRKKDIEVFYDSKTSPKAGRDLNSYKLIR